MIRRAPDPPTNSLPLPERIAAATDGFAALALRLARWAQSRAAADEGGTSPAGDVHGALVVGVTSCFPAEGVTTTIGRLAEAAAAVVPRGVLVVTQSRPGPGGDRNGTPVPFDGADVAEIAHVAAAARNGTDGANQLHVSALPMDEPWHRPLAANGWWSELQSLRPNYGLVLVDLPPAGHSASAATLAGRLDGVLLVIEAERTPSRVVQQVKERLEASGARLLGVVLNKAREYLPPWLDARLP